MPWTPEQSRRYAPAIGETVRANATVRLASTIDAIDPLAKTGRPRLWSTLIMLQALWRLYRAGAAWVLLPATCPPRQTSGSRLARGRYRRLSAGILDTQSVRTGPQAGTPQSSGRPMRQAAGLYYMQEDSIDAIWNEHELTTQHSNRLPGHGQDPS